MITIVKEQALRGTTERTYAIDEKYYQTDQKDIATMSPDELTTLYHSYLAGMSSVFARYIEGDHDIIADNLSFTQSGFWTQRTFL